MPKPNNLPDVSVVRAKTGISQEANALAAGTASANEAKMAAVATEIASLKLLRKWASDNGDNASAIGLENRILMYVAKSEFAAAKRNFERAGEMLAMPENGPSQIRDYQRRQAVAKAAMDVHAKEVADYSVAAGRTLHNIALRVTSNADLVAAQKSIEVDQGYEPKWKNERYDDPQARVDLTVERYPAMEMEVVELVRNDPVLFERAMEEADRLERVRIERAACEPYSQRPNNPAL